MKQKELRNLPLQIMVTKAERDMVVAYFEKRGLAVSPGVRMVLLELINKE